MMARVAPFHTSVCVYPRCDSFYNFITENEYSYRHGLPEGWKFNKNGLSLCPTHGMLLDLVTPAPRTDRIMTEFFETNPILAVIDELRETLKAKQADYAGTDPFNNFTESAATADITPRQAALALLGVKLSRIRNLERQAGDPANEPLLDSYLDLAGYAIILYAMAKETR